MSLRSLLATLLVAVLLWAPSLQPAASKPTQLKLVFTHANGVVKCTIIGVSKAFTDFNGVLTVKRSGALNTISYSFKGLMKGRLPVLDIVKFRFSNGVLVASLTYSYGHGERVTKARYRAEFRGNMIIVTGSIECRLVRPGVETINRLKSLLNQAALSDIVREALKCRSFTLSAYTPWTRSSGETVTLGVDFGGICTVSTPPPRGFASGLLVFNGTSRGVVVHGDMKFTGSNLASLIPYRVPYLGVYIPYGFMASLSMVREYFSRFRVEPGTYHVSVKNSMLRVELPAVKAPLKTYIYWVASRIQKVFGVSANSIVVIIKSGSTTKTVKLANLLKGGGVSPGRPSTTTYLIIGAVAAGVAAIIVTILTRRRK